MLARASREAAHQVPHAIRSRVEAATSADLGGVRLHTGERSHQAAQMLQARAYTIGQDVHFGRGQYRPGEADGDRLIAHELVHTLQKGPAVAQAQGDVSRPGAAAEVEADAVARQIVDGPRTAPPAPVHIGATRAPISRVELKNKGAKFTVDPYAELDADNGNDTARKVGVNIDITYASAEALRSDKIAFVQTMLTEKDGAPYLFENEKARATDKKAGEAGWAVDRLKDKKSPIYAQENSDSAGGNTTFGYRKSKTDSKDAWMHDAIQLNRAVGQKIEVDAVTFAFDETNGAYLGGVSWGFKTDKKGVTKKKKAALKTKGSPGGVQKAALKKWNEQADLTDVAKKNAADQVKVVVP